MTRYLCRIRGGLFLTHDFNRQGICRRCRTPRATWVTAIWQAAAARHA